MTLDGDVWIVRGLHGSGGTVRWRRFASGLHEPMTLAIRDEQIYVFDRNGIWRLRDTNGDGEADVHELFSNAFAQTADMREFPSTLRLAPGGEFVIAKGGQEATTLGKHNGSVLRISADGRRATVLGYGFRQPNIGVNIRTGLVTASDQQGHYIPSTPLHIVRDRQFYGFLATSVPREVYTRRRSRIRSTWIPHAVNASAMSQVWLFGARMGPLNDALVHIGFNKPELFRVLLNDRTREAAGRRREHHARVRVSAAQRLGESRGRPALHRGVPDPRLGDDRRPGSPAWAACATPARPSTLPREVVPMDKGVLLRFDVALDAAEGRRSRQLLARELELQAHLPVRLAAVQGRRHAGHGSAVAEQRVSFEGRSQRVRRRAGHEAGDADARRLVARDGRWREVSGHRLLHAVQICRRSIPRRRDFAI